MPEVSVIIPVYWTEAYLKQCVDSILMQTFTDFEVFLIDDGSPDRCPAICDEYARKDARVHAVHQENKGLSAARNAGLARACGRYVYFLDSDDYALPSLLETAVSKIRRGYDMVFFSYYIMGPNGTKPTREPAEGSWTLLTDRDRLSFFLQHLLLPDIPWQVWNILYDMSVIKKWDLRFVDNKEIFAEDLCFTGCYAAHAERILSIRTPLLVYRKRPDSLTGIAAGCPEEAPFYLGKMSKNAQTVQKWMEESGGCEAILEKFHVIHYLFVRHELFRYGRLYRRRPPRALRERMRSDLRESGQEAYFAAQIGKLEKDRKPLKKIGSFYSNHRALRLADYAIRGGTLRFSLDRRIFSAAAGVFRTGRALVKKIVTNIECGHR